MTRQFLRTCTAATLIAAATISPVYAQTIPSDTSDLMDFTCSQYLQSVRIADAGNRPSAERSKQAIAAQDALVSTVLWVHGYMSGRSPRAPEPLTRAWMIETVGNVAKLCRDNSKDGTMRVADAVAKI